MGRQKRRYHGRQPTLSEALAEPDFLEGSKVVEWDNGIDLTDHYSRIRREYRPTGKRGVIEIWREDSRKAKNIAPQTEPRPGTKVIRILKKDGTPGVHFIVIMPPRRGYVRSFPLGWKMEGVNPNASDPFRSNPIEDSPVADSSPLNAAKPSRTIDTRIATGLALTGVLLLLVMTKTVAPGSLPLGLLALIWVGVAVSYGRTTLIVVGLAALFMATCVISYALIPQLFIRPHVGWLFLPVLLLDSLACRYFKRPKWPQRYLPFLWWL